MNKKLFKEDYDTTLNTSKNLLTYKNNPLIQSIIKFFDKKKDIELVNITGQADLFDLDLRMKFDFSDKYQPYNREEAKEIVYDIKRELEGQMIKEYNLPPMSLSGLIVKGNIIEFSIALIYPNQGNVKFNYESVNKSKNNLKEVSSIYDKKIREIQNELTQASSYGFPDKKRKEELEKELFRLQNNKSQSNNIKYALKRIKTEAVKEPLPKGKGELNLEQEISNWDRLNSQLEEQRKIFEESVQEQLQNKKQLEEKIFKSMWELNIKTKKVNDIVAKIKEGGEKSQGPTPTEKLAMAMAKLNAATEKILKAEILAKTKKVPFGPHQSISKVSPGENIEEGIGDKVISLGKSFIEGIRRFFFAVKEFSTATDELQSVVYGTPLKENKTMKEDDGKRVTTLYLKEHIEEFINEAKPALGYAFKNIKELRKVADEIKLEYPDLANEIKSVSEEMLNQLKTYPEKFSSLIAEIKEDKFK